MADIKQSENIFNDYLHNKVMLLSQNIIVIKAGFSVIYVEIRLELTFINSKFGYCIYRMDKNISYIVTGDRSCIMQSLKAKNFTEESFASVSVKQKVGIHNIGVC